MQRSLFESEAFGNQSVAISNQQKAFTKNQKTFNRLTARINALKAEIEYTEIRLTNLSTRYAAEIHPLIVELGHEKIKLAKLLAAKYTTINLSQTKKEQVESIIFDFLDDAFSVVIPDEEAEKLYDQFSTITYKEAVQEQEESLKEDLQEQLYNLFGMGINIDDIKTEDEGFAKFQEKIKEHLEKKEQQKASRKKTKKQLEKEARLQQQEEAKKKNIRSIYMSLAKLLHPDTETDETLKKEKEEIMKEVTTAYNANDLSSLLILELKWIAKETSELEKMSNEKLTIYNAVLKEQVAELEQDKMLLWSKPAFQSIIHYAEMNELVVPQELQNEKRERTYFIAEIKKSIYTLQTGKTRSAITDCVNKYYKPDMDDEFDDFNQDFDSIMEMIMHRRTQGRR